MDYEREIQLMKERIVLSEKTLRILAYAAFGNAITIVFLGVSLLKIVQHLL